MGKVKIGRRGGRFRYNKKFFWYWWRFEFVMRFYYLNRILYGGIEF